MGNQWIYAGELMLHTKISRKDTLLRKNRPSTKDFLVIAEWKRSSLIYVFMMKKGMLFLLEIYYNISKNQIKNEIKPS